MEHLRATAPDLLARQWSWRCRADWSGLGGAGALKTSAALEVDRRALPLTFDRPLVEGFVMYECPPEMMR
jgi:hypothetical protein